MSTRPTTVKSLLTHAQELVPINQARFLMPDRKPFYAIAPIAFVERTKEASFAEIGYDFSRVMKSHKVLKSPMDHLTYRPTPMRFHPILKTPDGSIFFLCRWATITNYTESIAGEYCHKSGRRLGWFNKDTYAIEGLPDIHLKDCTLISEEDLTILSSRPPQSSSEDIVKCASRVLRKRTPQQIEVRAWSSSNDLDAHNRKLQQKLLSEVMDQASEYEHFLTKSFGQPLRVTAKLQQRVPMCGVERCVMWQVGSKKLYLAVSHEDVELPYLIALGIILE